MTAMIFYALGVVVVLLVLGFERRHLSEGWRPSIPRAPAPPPPRDARTPRGAPPLWQTRKVTDTGPEQRAQS